MLRALFLQTVSTICRISFTGVPILWMADARTGKESVHGTVASSLTMEGSMKIVLVNGRSFDMNVDAADIWSVYKLVRDGKLEAVFKDTRPPFINVRLIDADCTFGDLILSDFRDTDPPETLPTGEDPKG